MTTTHRGLWLTLLFLILAPAGCVSPPGFNEVQPGASTAAITTTTVSSTTRAEPTPPPESTTTSAPTPTATIAVARATNTPVPSPTVVAPEIVSLDDTLILYTTVVDMRTSPNRPPDVAPYDDYWAFKTWPPLPFLDPAVFDLFYGSTEFAPEGMSRFFHEVSPQLSPDGRYLLLPGLTSYPDAGIEGTGLWLFDLEANVARKLLSDGKVATWSPSSDAITYVEGDTLYTLNIADGAEPQPIFQHPDLWSQYAKWSPDGQWIAALTTSPELSDQYETGYAATYWLVPANGGPARELITQEAGAIEYSSDMSWSPDGQYLLVRNRVFDLEGNLLSPDYPGRVHWLPNDSRLLVNGQEGMRIMTIAGEEVVRLEGSVFADELAFSRDGRRLAYAPQSDEPGVSVAIYDMDSGETQVIGTIPGANPMNLLRWSADDNKLIASIVFDDGRFGIWSLEAKQGGAIEQLIEDAELIEVVPYPVR